VRAINSGGVGRVKERETHVGGQFVEARGARAITFPKPLALSRDRVTGTTIHHRFAPYNPRANPRTPSHLRPRASSHRTLYGARTTLFVCFQPVCARTRRYAISVSGMRVTVRTTDVSRISVRALKKKKKKKISLPLRRIDKMLNQRSLDERMPCRNVIHKNSS